jgi:imidazolonepropionase-like amidohydrolase
MGMSHLIKKTLEEGLAYGKAWAAHERGERAEPPPADERYDLFRGLAKREFPILVHTQVAQVLQATVRILHDELGVPCVLSHASFDAYRNAALVAERGMAVNVGPRQIQVDSLTGRIRGLAHAWWEGGVRNLTLNTDAPVVPQEDLVVQACVAVRFGLGEDAALRGITIQCARQMMIDHRVGSLEPGKDADIVLHSRHPLDLRSRILGVYVNGRLVEGEGGVGMDDRPGLSLPPEHVHDDCGEDE